MNRFSTTLRLLFLLENATVNDVNFRDEQAKILRILKD